MAPRKRVIGTCANVLGAASAILRAAVEWMLTPAGGGSPIADHGNYIQIWQCQPDGRWSFSREIWNSTSPAPPSGGGR